MVCCETAETGRHLTPLLPPPYRGVCRPVPPAAGWVLGRWDGEDRERRRPLGGGSPGAFVNVNGVPERYDA